MGFPEGVLTKTPGDLYIPAELPLLFSFFNPKISEAIPKLHKLFKGGEVEKIPAGSPLALEKKKRLPWLTGFWGNSQTGFLLPVK